MKKRIALSIVLGVCASLAFAEITIKGAADATVVPLQIVTNEDWDTAYVGAGLGRVGDPQGPKVRLDVAGSFENIVGFRGQVDFFKSTTTSEYLGFGDFVGVWVKPIDWLKFDVGRFNEDILRGKIGDDNWHSYTVDMQGKDAIFHWFNGDVGALIGLTPVEGLYIGLLVPKFAQFSLTKPELDYTSGASDGNSNGDSNRALRVYERIQIGLGYEIQGIGLARAQFVGANGGITSFDFEKRTLSGDAPRFEAAFAFTGVEGLTVDFGLKFWIPIKDWLDPADTWDEAKDEYVKLEKTGTYFKGLQFALGAQYALGDLGIAARVDAKMLENYESDDGNIKYTAPLNLNFHLWPSYNLGFATLGIDFGLEVNGKSKLETPAGSTDGEEDGILIGFGAWLKKSFGSSSIKGGLAYRAGTEYDGQKQNGIFTIPIVFDYSF